MSDPNLSDIDFENKMARVWTTLKSNRPNCYRPNWHFFSFYFIFQRWKLEGKIREKHAKKLPSKWFKEFNKNSNVQSLFSHLNESWLGKRPEKLRPRPSETYSSLFDITQNVISDYEIIFPLALKLFSRPKLTRFIIITVLLQYSDLQLFLLYIDLFNFTK